MTLRSHGKAWNEFSRWCEARKLQALPAHAWTVATYIRWCEPRLDYSDIVAITKAIARRHLIKGFPDPDRNPLVKRTLASIERRIANSHQRSALFDDDITKDEIENPEDPETFFEEPPKTRPTKRVIRSMRSTPKLVSRRRPR